MAIYHLRLKVLGRSLGRAAKPGGATRRSAIAAAAYRSGDRLYDMAQGRWFEFDKPDVVHTEILYPAGAEVRWDRQTLWNLVERSEKRVDAQLAREIEITLPRELSRPDQIALVRRYVDEHFVRQGMVADIAIHAPDATDGLEQPHAHVMLTMRRLDASTPTGFSATKERDWNEREDVAQVVNLARKAFNNSGREDHRQALEMAEGLRNVNRWRAAWADAANAALAASFSPARIDHRTLEKQGIVRMAEPYLGLARHMVETAYAHIRERVTQWVAVKKRSSLYRELETYRHRDPTKLADFILRLSDMAEEFTAQFRNDKPIPEVDLER